MSVSSFQSVTLLPHTCTASHSGNQRKDALPKVSRTFANFDGSDGVLIVHSQQNPPCSEHSTLHRGLSMRLAVKGRFGILVQGRPVIVGCLPALVGRFIRPCPKPSAFRGRETRKKFPAHVNRSKWGTHALEEFRLLKRYKKQTNSSLFARFNALEDLITT
jgi:hypothetical protein